MSFTHLVLNVHLKLQISEHTTSRTINLITKMYQIKKLYLHTRGKHLNIYSTINLLEAA